MLMLRALEGQHITTQQALSGCETETKELLGGTKELIDYPSKDFDFLPIWPPDS